ncbi:hypothetical protein JVU11DRAFT_11903 [Chiua virens]|nr:hypothetical protein JVU11DRAFT_11903 [Chiua virens]
MIPTRPLLILANFCFISLCHSTFASLQNVTVDDAVQAGPTGTIPEYLPSASYWNTGNNCSKCLVKPDPSMAYNGTWHDTTFNPDNGISQKIEFTFIGSALYIFFILANSVPDATTLTDLDFYMDDIPVGTYVHSPTTSTDYQYNVPVYVNKSVTPGKHTIMIEPVNSPGDSVLMLFDYLIYTTGTEDATTTSLFVPPSPSTISDAPSPPISSGTQSTTSRQNIAVIVGGTVGGVAGVVLVTTLLLCYKRRQRHNIKRSRLSPLDDRPVLLGSLTSLSGEPWQGTSRAPQHVAPPFAQVAGNKIWRGYVFSDDAFSEPSDLHRTAF